MADQIFMFATMARSYGAHSQQYYLYPEELGGRLPELATRNIPLVPPVVKVPSIKKLKDIIQIEYQFMNCEYFS